MAYAPGLYWPMGSAELPAGAVGGAGGSILTQVAPMACKRMSAAGPGKFKARLTMRTPLSACRGLVAAVAVMGRSL